MYRLYFEESNNLGKAGTLQHLTLHGINGFVLPNILIKDDSSILKSSRTGIAEKDCDGIFLTERAGEKFIYICELKSTYSTQQITKAKEQIVGSCLKLHSLMSLLQAYQAEEWQVRGIIASFAPTPEQEAAILRLKEQNDPAANFCYNLQRDGIYHMPETNCKSYYVPLNVPELLFTMCGYPIKQKTLK